LTIDHFDNFAAVVGQKGIRLAILAVPAAIAQNTAEIMAKAGILGILNFAPVNLNLPSSVSTANVDLTIELEQLVFAVVQNRQLD
jgi:redox-sensing transcriptional repressor